MSDQWQFQIRINLSPECAELARHDPGNPAIKPVTDILIKHRATMKSQFDAFAEYVAEAEKHGVDQFPLYKWTKLTIDDPVKREKHSKSFALQVDGNTVYPETTADALRSDLEPLVDGRLVTHLSKHDTNPANNIPVPAHLRS